MHGNGSNDYLNIQIQGAPPNQGAGVGDHVIHLDYSGWRYFTLCEHDNGEYEDIAFKYDEEDEDELTGIHLRHRRPLSFDRIGYVRILFSGESKDVYISDIRALSVSKDPVINPAVSDGENTISFQGQINPGCYLEFNPEDNSCLVYDIYGNTTPMQFTGEAPEIHNGPFTLYWTGKASGSHRIKGHLIVYGEKYFNTEAQI